MLQQRDNGERRGELGGGIVGVAIDKDKYSQRTLKYAVEHFATRGQTIRLLHVIPRNPTNPNPNPITVGVDDTIGEVQLLDNQTAELFLPFRCFCSRRQVQSEAVVLEDQDIAKALIEYVTKYGIQTLLLGTTSKTGISRLFKATDIPASVLKWAPDFCSVYIISKGKVTASRIATRPIIRGDGSLLHLRLQNSFEPPSVISLSRENDGFFSDDEAEMMRPSNCTSRASNADTSFLSFYENLHSTALNKQNMGIETDSFNSSSSSSGLSHRRSNASRISLDCSSKFPPPSLLTNHAPNFDASRISLDCSSKFPPPSLLTNHTPNFASDFSIDTQLTSPCSESLEHANNELRSLRIELKQTMDMYHAACKEALAAKHKVLELEEWKRREETRKREAELETEAATASPSSISIVEEERERYKAAMEAAQAAQKFVELEVQKRVEALERKRLFHTMYQSHLIAKYQNLFHILAVVFVFYVYFTL